MSVKIETSLQSEPLVPMSKMTPGQYGKIIKIGMYNHPMIGSHVYHDGEKVIILNRPDRWSTWISRDDIAIRILQPGESITITVTSKQTS